MIPGFDTSHSRRSLPPFEQGAIPFMGANFLLERDAAELFWNNSTKRFGVGTASPAATIQAVEGTTDIFSAVSGVNEHFAVGQTEVTINEGGLSTLAFRVEGDTDTDLIRTFPAVNAVAIGQGAVAAKLSIQGTTASQTTLSVRGAVGQTTSVFEAADSAGTRMFASLPTLLACNPDQSPTIDFRVSGDTLLNLLFVRASTDRVGIGTNVPSGFFSVGATSQFQVGSDGDLDRIKDVPYSWPAANAAGILQNDGAGVLSWTALSAIDHGALGGLADDDHTQYLLLAGRSGGQLAKGGTAAGDHFDLDPSAAANYTGSIRFNTTASDYGSGNVTGLAQWPNGFTHGGGVGTVVSGSALVSTVTIDVAETLTTLNMYNFAPTIATNNGITGTMGAIGFACGPTFSNANADAVTGATINGFVHQPIWSNTGGGTLNGAQCRGFRSVPSAIPSGVTLTQLRHFHAEAVATTGTITTHVGYDCDIATGGTCISYRSTNATAQNRHAGPMVIGENISVGTDERLKVSQSSTTAAIPVLKLDQSDVDEPFIKFVGDAAAATLTRDLVAAGAVTTATIAGYLKIEVQDDGNQITDQDYYVPFYTLA